MNTKETLYGWWSDSQAEIGGYCIYTTPSGGQVRVSMVSPTSSHHSYWKDIRFVGEVVRCVSSHDERGVVISPAKVKVMPSPATDVVGFMAFKGLTTFQIGKG